jgi:hypothetical protein
MKFQILLIALFAASCQSQQQKNVQKQNGAIKDSSKTQAQQAVDRSIVDIGRVWFQVSVTKNDTPYMHYEGAWPVLLMSNNFATLQLIASKDLMSVSNMLTIYMKGLPTGKVPVVLSGNEKGTVNMIMSPVINGSYDIPISPDKGFLEITKNTGSVLSGTFEAKAVDDNKNNFLLTGNFFNVKVNDEDKTK